MDVILLGKEMPDSNDILIFVLRGKKSDILCPSFENVETMPIRFRNGFGNSVMIIFLQWHSPDINLTGMDWEFCVMENWTTLP